MEQKRSARMTGVPQLGIPDILVDDEDDRATDAGAEQSAGAAPSQMVAATFLSAEHAAGPAQHHRSWSGASMDISLHDTNYAHPLSAPWTGGLASPTSPGGLQPQRHQHSPSTFSFELQEPGAPSLADGSRRGSAVSAVSAVSPGLVREMLDDSVWVESIRRSATQRRSG
jgi:voltage-dependent calcium channel